MAHCNFLNSFKLQTLQSGPHIKSSLLLSQGRIQSWVLNIHVCWHFMSMLHPFSIEVYNFMSTIYKALQFACCLGLKYLTGVRVKMMVVWAVSCCPRLGLVLWSLVLRSGHTMPHTEPSHHQNDQPGLGQWNLTSPPPQPWPPVNPGKYLILIVNKNISL